MQINWQKFLSLWVDIIEKTVNNNTSTNEKVRTLPIIYLAFCIADLVQSTLGPRVQNPCLSGGLTCIRATSRSMILRWKRRGISLRKIGVKSARPSFTASRQFAPVNKELLLKIPTMDCKIIGTIWFPFVKKKKRKELMITKKSLKLELEAGSITYWIIKTFCYPVCDWVKFFKLHIYWSFTLLRFSLKKI